MHVAYPTHINLRKRQVAIALVLVLWILMLLTVIAGSLVYSSRAELAIARNSISRAKAEALTEAGIQRALVELLKPQTDMQRWQGNGLVRLWNFDGHDVAVTILDESAKIDINAASDVLLRGLFQSQGINDADAEALADAVLDWRDGDDLRRLHGAEKDDYVSAGRAYVPANGPFAAIEELRQVLGMSEAIYRKIEPFITIYSNQAGINTTIAQRGVLLALPGATAEAVDEYLAQRQELLARGLPVAAFPPGQAFTANSTNSVFTIQAKSILSDNVGFFREAVVRLTGNGKEPTVVLAWRAPDSQERNMAESSKDKNGQ